MTSQLITRRAVLKTLGGSAGAVAVLPLLSEDGLAAFAEIQRTKAAPRLKVLTPAQYATVESLVETIIPADERSPGAKEARVADYFDLLLSEAQLPLRKQWLDGLTSLDAEAKARFGAAFVRLQPAQVEALLTDISRYELVKPKPEEDASRQITRNEQPTEKPILVEGLLGDVSRLDPTKPKKTPLEEFFGATKRATIQGYYTSEIGIHKELRYKGNKLLAEFVGCETQDGKDCPHCGQKAQG